MMEIIHRNDFERWLQIQILKSEEKSELKYPSPQQEL